MYRFTYDHAISDGARGYGCVVVEHGGDVWYIGRTFAPTVLVERFPDARLTYEQARQVIAFLSVMPTGKRAFMTATDDDDNVFHSTTGGDCNAAPEGMWCECEADSLFCNYAFAERLSRTYWR